MRHPVLLLLLLQLLAVFPLAAETYYISASGNDSASGTSPRQAWRTIAKVNGQRYTSGDSILFEGGSVFRGSLYFTPANITTTVIPVVVSSFGASRASIDADTSYGFYAHNVAGLEIRNLNFNGRSYTLNRNCGILFYNDLPGNVKLPHVVIDQVEVSGFRKSGIAIGAWNGNSGFSDIRITNAVVHNIGSEGITTWGEFSQEKVGHAHRNVYIGHCHVYQVYGLPRNDNHSGSGIVVSDVDGGVVEYSVAHSSGMNNVHCGGPVGIWAWDANNITIQYNEAYNMSAGSGCDGGGFDLDGGVTNSVMQYNYSHNNDGAGFLVAQFAWARPMYNNIVRYNISENDGKKNGYKGITLWVADQHNYGGNSDLLVYNNTIFADKRVAPSGGGVYFKSGEHYNVKFFNNIFYTRNGAPMVVVADTTNLEALFQHNAYYSEDGAYTWTWGQDSYTSLEHFRQRTGQETRYGMPAGIAADPKLAAPGTGGTLGYPLDMKKLQARYSPLKKSPLVGQGISIPTPLPFRAATQDATQQVLNVEAPPDLGAIQYVEPKRFEWVRSLLGRDAD